MKKVACAILILTMAIFLINPLSSDARGGYSGGHGGGYGGYHGGGHGRYSGGHGGGYGGYHRGGWHGGYHGGYGGYRGWYYGGWWYPWAVTIPFLPFYYQTVWVGGYPYYYADGTYYAPTADGYMTVKPPQGAVNQAPPSVPSVERLFIYPRQGQSEEQQAKDRYECHSWAVSQIWREPRKVSMEEWTVIIKSMAEDRRGQMLADYQRAQCACLEGRGYTVK